MAITSTQSIHPASVCNIAVGRYIDTGTVAAFTLTIGFKARYFRLVNLTDRTSEEWFEGMAALENLKTAAAGTVTLGTTVGPTISDRTILVGLDTDIIIASKQISWIAIG